MNFDVHLRSLEAAPGRDPVEALVQVFRLDQRRAEQLLSRLPYVVKKGVSREQAERVVDLLRRIGGDAEMVPSSYVEPMEASLVAPLPLEPPPRLKPHAPDAPTTGMHAMPGYVAPDVRDPFRNAPSRSMDASAARSAVRPPQQSAPAQRPQAAARPQPQAQPAARVTPQAGQQSPRMATPASAKGPGGRAATPAHSARPRPGPDTQSRESDGFEADISAVLPPSFPPPQAPSLRPPAAQRGASLRPPSAQQARSQPMYPGSPAADGRTSTYGAPQAYRDTNVPTPQARAGASAPIVDAPGRVSAYNPPVESEPPSQVQRASAYGAAGSPYGAAAQPGMSDFDASLHAAATFGASAPPLQGAAPAFAGLATGAFRALSEPSPAMAPQAFPTTTTGAFRAVVEPVVPASTSLRSPPSADNTQTSVVFPTLAIHGAPVTAKHQIVPGTTNAAGWSLVALGVLGLFALASLVLLSYGFLLALSLGALLGAHVLHGYRAMHAVRASGIPVGQGQFPEIYACVKQFSLRLGMADVPSTYITRSATRGARAHRKLKRLALELDEAFVVELALSPRPEALSFHIARELSRHALGHTKAPRRLLALINPWLARRDVLSADAAATALVVDRGIARAALLAMLARPPLARHLDADEIERVAVSLRRDGEAWTLLRPERCVLARIDAFVRGYR